MRKTRDYDAESRASGDKAKALKARKVQQLGESVAATGADALDMETLAGALIAAVEANAEAKEAWRAKGVAFFQRRGRKGGRGAAGNDKEPSEAGAGGLQGWVVARRERTRHSIESGGLVQKAGLVDLADDDRATIYGALSESVGKARGDETGDTLALWKRRGKRAKLSWALPSCVVIAGCDRDPVDPRGLEPGETLSTVAGTGRTEATPDQASFTAGSSSVAADAKSASARNAEAMSRIAAALARLNVPARDIQTRSSSVNRVDYGPNKGRFEASNTLTVRMRDTTRVGAAIAAVTDAGANIVSGPDLSVADPEKANSSGYDAAYKAARAK
ncbi:hypothetical protein OY671_007351, partial [Metschnikowia pulcherrima]